MAGAATVDKALDVLFHLHAASGALGLTEIGRALELPKSSCHRLLTTLVERGVVDRDERGRYLPGLALLSLGLGAQAREPVVRAARPVLEAESAALGETVFLVAERRGALRVLDKVDGPGFLRAAPEVGDLIPSETTAAGQLYRAWREGAWNGNSGEGVDDRDSRAAAAFGRIVAEGFATNRDAWIDGLSVLAVPVWQGRFREPDELVGVLALGAASARYNEIGESQIADQLIAAAAVVRGSLSVGPKTAANKSEARGSARSKARMRKDST